MRGWTYLTAAGIVSHKPCRLLAIVLTPSGSDGEIKAYDGENTTAPIIVNLFIKSQTSTPFAFPGGLRLDRGLYIGSFSHVASVLVQWEVD